MNIGINNFKKRIAIIAIFCMMFTLVPVNSFGVEATDISKHWAQDKIQEWVDNGLISGYKDGSFKPDNNITRAEFMTLVNSSFGFKSITETNFKDVDSNDWYADAVTKAVAAGYLSGYQDGTIRPDSPISREEAATIMMKINNIEGNSQGINKFSDKKRFIWSGDEVGATSIANIMNGYPDGTFKPQNLIKRGEAVAVLDKAVAYKKNNTIYTEAGTYGPAGGVLNVIGNVILIDKGTTIQNMVIEGNLIVNKSVGEGNIFLRNVTVKGETFIYGDGIDDFIIIDSTLGEINISKEKGKVRLLISGTSKVREVLVNSGATLEEKNMSGSSEGFGKVKIDISEDESITLIGKFTDVTVDSPSREINVPKWTTIDSLTLNYTSNISGTGTITNADINATGSSFETAPVSVDVAAGVSAPKVEPKAPIVRNRGNSEGATVIQVSAITITGDVVVGATLSAAPTPGSSTGMYQWKSSDSIDGTYANITGATSSTYIIDDAYAGMFIKVAFTASGLYTGTQTSEATGAITTALAAAKVTAKADVATALGTYTESNYTTTNWTTLNAFHTDGDAAINLAADLTGVTSAKNTATAGMAGVQTIAQTLAAAKTAAKADVATSLGTYTESNYTTSNWTTLNAYHTDGDTAIDAAADLTAVATAKTTAINGMEGVVTIAETLAAAKVTAKADVATALGTYTESNYTAANWTTLNAFHTDGDTAIDLAADLTVAATAKTTAINGMDGVQTIAETLAATKVTAKDDVATALGTYTQGNYTTTNWTSLNAFHTDGDTAIDAAADLTSVATSKTTAINGMDGIVTIAETLAAAKVTAKDDVATAFGTYTESDYATANWTALNAFHTNGDTAIDAAADLTAVATAKTTAINGMAGVETIYTYTTSANKVTITGYTGNDTVITIPSALGGNPVTIIGANAFQNNTTLTSITIQSGVTDIGNNSFNSCTGLTSVIIPDGVKSIGDYAFQGCKKLTSITIPNSVTLLGGTAAFSGCTSLSSITIPNSVTFIGGSTFSGCTALTNVTIGSSVTFIGGYAFWNCTKLGTLTIPSSVTIIQYHAFQGCTSLTSLTIPSSVTSLQYNAFNGCTTLTSITMEGTITASAIGIDLMAANNNIFKTAYLAGGAGTYTGTLTGDWTKYVPISSATISITTAKGLIPTTKSVVEATDTNLLTILNAIGGMTATGVTLTLESSNANIAANGAITYTGSQVVGNVIVKINKADGSEQTQTVSVTVPAHIVVPPVHLATAGSFTDTDVSANEVAGTINWTSASPTTGITGYKIYWGSDATTILSGTSVLYTVANPETTSQTVAADTALASGATHYLIYSYNAAGSSTSCLAVAITDVKPPTVLATAGSFTDTDVTANEVAGTINWTAASPTTGITGYKIYWGSDEATILSGTSVLYTVANPETNSQTVAADTALASGATHYLIYSYNAAGSSTSCLAVAITDVKLPTAVATYFGEFQDFNSKEGFIYGTLQWSSQTKIGIIGYKVYWGSDETTILAGDTGVEYTADFNSTFYSWAVNTEIPAGAKYFLIYSYNAAGNSTTGCLAVAIKDAVPEIN